MLGLPLGERCESRKTEAGGPRGGAYPDVHWAQKPSGGI